MPDLPMPEPGFTKAETEAFDCGVKDASERGYAANNPYDERISQDEWDAWETGFSAGIKNFEE